MSTQSPRNNPMPYSCNRCGWKLRRRTETLADHPGTRPFKARGKCAQCYEWAWQSGTLEPLPLRPTEAWNLAEYEAFTAARRRRGIPEQGLPVRTIRTRREPAPVMA